MPEPIKVFGKRVSKGESGQQPITGAGYVTRKFPENGFLFSLNIPCVPIFVSDSDLKKLKTSEKDVEICSWQEK